MRGFRKCKVSAMSENKKCIKARALRILIPKGEMRMRKARLAAGMILCVFFLGIAAYAAEEERWYYRVIARNDAAEAQEEKIRVRDAVLSVCPETAKELPAAFPKIKETAESLVSCRMEIKTWSPDTETPPACTVYITIGEGRGRNCWGVLYADSLLMAKAEEDPEEPERVEFVWPFWNWLLSLFGL